MKAKKVIVSVFMIICIIINNVVPIRAAEITAPSAIMIEANSGKVIYEKNPRDIRVCASITKIMTMILIMEALDEGKISMTDTVTASEHAASMGGSDIWLKPGESMTVDEMIKATVVASANDAAVALAEHISGSEEEFVRQMNEKAKKLGMKDTVFKNCNGLDEDGHVTSAYDVALMSRELTKHKEIFNYTSIWIDYLRDGKTQLVNTNKLLKSYKGITGLKTGTTSKAGSCISATAERNNLSLIAVVLGSSGGKERFKDAAALLDYGFANYSMVDPPLPDDAFTQINVVGGMTNKIDTQSEIGSRFMVNKGKEKEIKAEVQLPEQLEAPVKKGQIVGKVIYKLGDETIGECNISSKTEVEKIKFSSVFGLLIHTFLNN